MGWVNSVKLNITKSYICIALSCIATLTARKLLLYSIQIQHFSISYHLDKWSRSVNFIKSESNEFTLKFTFLVNSDLD